jgi:hypothetical protein
MTTGSELFGWGEPGARGGGQGSTGAPDFVRSDRGDADDHWSHAAGQACGKCAVELTSADFVRRRHDGTWVHESCPRTASTDDAATAAGETTQDDELKDG